MAKEDLSRAQQIAFEHRLEYLKELCKTNPDDTAARVYVELGINEMDNDPDAKARVEEKIEDEMKQFEKWTAEFDSKTDFERMQLQKKIDAELRFSKDYFGTKLKEENTVSGGSEERFNADALRRGTKDAILLVIEKYAEVPNLDKRIKQLLEYVREYCIIDSTNATEKVQAKDRKGWIKKEASLQTQIISLSKTLFDKIQNEYMDLDSEDGPLENDSYRGLIKTVDSEGKIRYEESEEAKKKGDELKMVSGIMTYFSSLRDGNLLAPEDEIIDYSRKEIKGDKSDDREIDLGKTTPLFSHEPTPDDIVQGELGDCYFMAAMASLAQHDPQAIKNAIVDNGDGTCTVRLYNRVCGTDGPGMNDTFEPVYIKVSKKVPESGSGSNSAPWVSIMERAYAASGKYISEKSGKIYNHAKYQKVQNFDKLYDQLKNMDKSDWPSHQECPALIDENGNLHKYEPSYSQIKSGISSMVIEAIGGPGYKAVDYTNPLSGDYITERYLRDFFRNVYINGGKRMENEVQDRNYANNGENLELDDFKQILYVSVMGKEPPRLADGRMDPADDDVRLAEEIAELFYISAQKVEESGLDIKAGISEKFADICYEALSTINPYNAFKEMWVRDENHVKDYLKVIQRGVNNVVYSSYKAAAPRTGEYDAAQEEMFFEIETALKNKNSVVLGTKSNGKTDADKFDGLHYKHAYTVEGVTTKKLNGKEFKFLIVRNPHASNAGRTYEFDANKGEVVPKEIKTKNGLSYIELSDLSQCETIGINKPKVYEKLIGYEKIDLSTVSNYSRVLETFEKELKSAYRLFGTRDSQQYKNLRAAVSNMKKTIVGGLGKNGSFGKDMSVILNGAEKVKAAADAYMERCAGVKTPGTVRKKRMGITRGLQKLTGDIIESFQKGMPLKDPKGKLKDELAEKILKGINEYQQKNGNIVFKGKTKDRMLGIIKKEPAFKDSIAKGSYMNVFINSKLRASELADLYRSKAAKTVEQEIKRAEIENTIEDKNVQLEQPAFKDLV